MRGCASAGSHYQSAPTSILRDIGSLASMIGEGQNGLKPQLRQTDGNSSMDGMWRFGIRLGEIHRADFGEPQADGGLATRFTAASKASRFTGLVKCSRNPASRLL